jgi:hypothetical protein
LQRVNTFERLGVARDLWEWVREPEKADLLAEAIGMGDAPLHTRAFLLRALRELGERGQDNVENHCDGIPGFGILVTVLIYVLKITKS